MAEPKRFVMDCRLNPSAKCSLTLAGTEQEVLDLAEYHVIHKHGFHKAPQLREQLKSFLKEELLVR
ncbi:MAG TPA: DUF1059 domain-containing protein [Elusimicrobia bacterium]|nr:DUF1059 domain-containing protein [Elusimicrobiota bacterium]HBT62622.1 DUF1059 domain-containing protein [Elusimicrobiota bacterium]